MTSILSFSFIHLSFHPLINSSLQSFGGASFTLKQLDSCYYLQLIGFVMSFAEDRRRFHVTESSPKEAIRELG